MSVDEGAVVIWEMREATVVVEGNGRCETNAYVQSNAIMSIHPKFQ